MKYLSLIFVLVLAGCGSRQHEAKLRPVIVSLDAFIERNGRLPFDEEFRHLTKMNDSMLVLRDRTHPYAAHHGASKETDYMLGIWRAEWFHYYKSWDQRFLNASDEKL